ncbi:MAG: hypothetical protein N2Z76_05725 [Treponemataceae bacterium]|nr:hypothetical protein [Treponemataceae bacterium]
MKKARYFFQYAGIGSLWLILASCTLLSNQNETLEIAFPELPSAWKETLGEAAWHVEWLNREGKRERFSFPVGTTTVTIPWDFSWGTPLWAYPYWPERSIPPGMVHPAGALYPLEVELATHHLTLTWLGGVAATLYEALLRYSVGGTLHRPECFNWSRFYELLSQYRAEKLIMDPWAIDWEAVAQKTVRSGFTSRYIQEAPSEKKILSVPSFFPPTQWVPDSPFGVPLFVIPSMPLELSCYHWVDRLLSPYGILSYSQQGQVYRLLPGF